MRFPAISVQAVFRKERRRIERLMACALLCRVGPAPRGEYEERLHEAFLEHPKALLLPELKWRPSAQSESMAPLERHWAEYRSALSAETFGVYPFDRLRQLIGRRTRT